MGADDREAMIYPGIRAVDVMPWLQDGAKVRAADFKRAIAEAEERGYRHAIADLRDESDRTSVDTGKPAIWVAFASAADFLESRLPGSST